MPDDLTYDANTTDDPLPAGSATPSSPNAPASTVPASEVPGSNALAPESLAAAADPAFSETAASERADHETPAFGTPPVQVDAFQQTPGDDEPTDALPISVVESVASGPDPLAEAVTTLDGAMRVLARLRDRVRAQVLGRDEVIDFVLVALLADGHVLLEDFPGSGKTTLAKTLGASIVDDRDAEIAAFRRIQFTPDLLPSDVTGVSVFDARSSTFHFRRGPIFAHVVLADEINRTSPKVQSAMLEAMAEKQVTVDNTTYTLDDLFFVIATQNPLDLAGTYPLPVAQLDRFLFKIRMEHIDRDSELEVLETHRSRRDVERADLPRVTRTQVLAARRVIDEQVAIDGRVKECLVDIARAVRDDERVLQGSSTRSLVLMLPALQALAALRGRDYVAAADIQDLVPRVLGHRIELAPGVGEIDGVLRDAVTSSIEGLARSTLARQAEVARG